MTVCASASNHLSRNKNNSRESHCAIQQQHGLYKLLTLDIFLLLQFYLPYK